VQEEFNALFDWQTPFLQVPELQALVTVELQTSPGALFVVGLIG